MGESLLQGIQNDTLDEAVPLASALRKTLALGIKLKAAEIEGWVGSELNGYRSANKDLPSYRIYSVSAFCTLSNGVKMYSNIPVPTYNDEYVNKIVKTSYFPHSIAELESLASQGAGKNEDLRCQLPSLILQYIGEHSNGFECLSAWQMIGVAAVAGILGTVRTRLLQFALKLEAAYPEASDLAAMGRDKRTIHNLFDRCIMNPENVTNITGNHGSNIATGEARISSSTAAYHGGQSLAAALADLRTHIGEVATANREEVARSIDLLVSALDDFTVPKSSVLAAVEVIAEKAVVLRTRLEGIYQAALVGAAGGAGEWTVQNALNYYYGKKP